MENEKAARTAHGLPAVDPSTVEPWLRGTLNDVRVVPRAVLHALELAGEDLEKWCGSLTDAEMNAHPGGLAPVAFHLRHIAQRGSLADVCGRPGAEG